VREEPREVEGLRLGEGTRSSTAGAIRMAAQTHREWLRGGQRMFLINLPMAVGFLLQNCGSEKCEDWGSSHFSGESHCEVGHR